MRHVDLEPRPVRAPRNTLSASPSRNPSKAPSESPSRTIIWCPSRNVCVQCRMSVRSKSSSEAVKAELMSCVPELQKLAWYFVYRQPTLAVGACHNQVVSCRLHPQRLLFRSSISQISFQLTQVGFLDSYPCGLRAKVAEGPKIGMKPVEDNWRAGGPYVPMVEREAERSVELRTRLRVHEKKKVPHQQSGHE